MLKRIVVLMCVLVVCLLCAVPAFAVGAGGSSNDVFATSQFDTLTIMNGAWDGSVVAWPFNEFTGSPGYVSNEDESDNEFFSAYTIGSQSSISGSFTIRDASQFRLESDYFFFYGDSHDNRNEFYIRPSEGSDVIIDRVVLSYEVLWILPDSLGVHYGIQKEGVYKEYTHDALPVAGEIDLPRLVMNSYHDAVGHLLDGWALIADFSMTVYSSSHSADSSFDVWTKASSLRLDYASKWVERHNIPAAGGNFDGFSWLARSVAGFLEFEIFPGFSFGMIMQLAVIAALVLWLIRLLS